jgi:hypothetical protein
MKLSYTSLALGGITTILASYSITACRADSTPKLPPGMLEQAQYEAHRLFKANHCEVWGLTYRKENHVIALCPPTLKPDVVTGKSE